MCLVKHAASVAFQSKDFDYVAVDGMLHGRDLDSPKKIVPHCERACCKNQVRSRFRIRQDS